MIALQAYDDQTCKGCGGYLPETTAPEADEGYRVDNPTRCHRCTAIGQKADSYHKAKQPHALLYRAERKG
jgi:hypothetical protein